MSGKDNIYPDNAANIGDGKGNFSSLSINGSPVTPIPSGGATGAVLAKASATNYDLHWITADSPTGGYPSYSSGTWSPSLSFATAGTSSFSITAEYGQYVKVGSIVYVDFYITFTPTLGTASGNFQIGNLPFPVGGDLDSVGSIRALTSGFLWPTGTTMVSLITSSTLALGLSCMGSGVNASQMKPANLSNGISHNIGGTIVYRR